MSGSTGASSLMSSSALTPAEEAYFSTRGEDTSAFAAPSNEPAPSAGTPAPDASSSPAPAGTPAAPAIPGTAEPAAPTAATVPGADPTDDELITQFENDAIGEDGKPRSGGQFIRRENFRVISNKYKSAKAERDAIRVERDASNTELAKLREDRARLDERLKLFTEALAPPVGQAAAPAAPAAAAPAEAPKPVPDPGTDPIGALSWLIEQQTKAASEIGKAQQTAQNAQNTLSDAEAYQRSTTAFQNDARRFVAAGNADFVDAYQHSLNARAQMYFYSGVTDRNEIQRRVREDERVVVDNALKAGKSPAEAIYAMAQSLGYQKKAPAPAPAVDPADPSAPTVPAAPAPAVPAATAAPAPASAVDEVARLAAAQAASKTLSNVGGGTPVLQMTIERLLAMTDSEFSAYERQNPGVVATLMGKE